MNKQSDPREKIGKVLEDRLRFESILSDMSARFVRVSADRLDGEIENALKMVLEFFQVDRCGLICTSKDRTAWQLTHVAYADDQVPRVPVGVDFHRTSNPWAYEMLFEKGRTLAFSSMDDLPPEAHVDRKAWIERGTRSTLLIPIQSGEILQYVISINAMKSERDWPEEFIPRLRVLGEIFVNAMERRQNRLDLEEQLRFEMVLSEISGRFVNLPADQVDSEILDAERRICECLGIDVAGLWQWSDEAPGPLLLTHLYGTLEAPLPDRMEASEYFPWYQTADAGRERRCLFCVGGAAGGSRPRRGSLPPFRDQVQFDPPSGGGGQAPHRRPGLQYHAGGT